MIKIKDKYSPSDLITAVKVRSRDQIPITMCSNTQNNLIL